MKFQKIVNFLDTTSSDKDLPRFVTKKWIKVYDQSGKNYNALLLRSHLRDHSDAYIVVKGTITVIDPYNTKRKVLHLKTIQHLTLHFKNQWCTN